MSSDYLLYHEFTHALDISLYGAKDTNKYNQLRGYLEYHAAQVEMLKLLGAEDHSDHIAFSMRDTITDIEGARPVLEYVEHGIAVVTSAMQKPDFKRNIASVFHAVGALYNHLGRTSICVAASSDFDEYAAKLDAACPGVDLFGREVWSLITSVFSGVMNERAIPIAGQIYYGSLIQLFKEYGL